MFAFKTFVALALPLLAVATPLAVRTDTPACNTGTLNCCQSTQPAGGISGLLGILTGNNCSPITAIGVGSGANCQQQTVCCTGNNQSGLIVLGCTPINLAL